MSSKPEKVVPNLKRKVDEELEWATDLRAHLADVALNLDLCAVEIRTVVIRVGKGKLLLAGGDVRLRAGQIRDRIRRSGQAQLGVSRELGKFKFEIVEAFGSQFAAAAAGEWEESKHHTSVQPFQAADFRNARQVLAYADSLRSHMVKLSLELEARSSKLPRLMMLAAMKHPFHKASARLMFMAPILRARLRRAARGQHDVTVELVTAWHEFAAVLPKRKK
jgi:hypothetical protein